MAAPPSEDWTYMDSLRPPVYVCLRRKPSRDSDGNSMGYSPMVLDGRVDKEEWEHVPWSDPFVDIEGPEHKPAEYPQTRFKMMHDHETLYVAAELTEPKIWGTITQKNSTMYHENDFEVFFNPDGSRHHYYELEMNCLNTIWELLLHRPYKDGYSIENPFNLASLRSAVFVDGVTNSPETECTRWSVEISWSLAELQQFDRERLRALYPSASGILEPPTATPRPPSARSGATPRAAITTTQTLDGDVWRVNFSRVQYELETVVHPDTQQLQYQKVAGRREANIVWSPTGVVDVHRPERWGLVFFSSQEELPGGESELASARRGFLDEQLAMERVLDAVYYAERAFFAIHGAFAASMAMLYAVDDAAGVPKDVSKPVFPLMELVHRFELSFPVISCRSELEEPGAEVLGVVANAEEASKKAADAGSRSSSRSGRRYAPALDTDDEEDLNEARMGSKGSATAPILSPRSQIIKQREAQNLFANFQVSVRSATQHWHLAHDGRLWQTPVCAGDT